MVLFLENGEPFSFFLISRVKKPPKNRRNISSEGMTNNIYIDETQSFFQGCRMPIELSSIERKHVITKDGRNLGDMVGSNIDTAKWTVMSLVVELHKDMVKPLNVKKPFIEPGQDQDTDGPDRCRRWTSSSSPWTWTR